MKKTICILLALLLALSALSGCRKNPDKNGKDPSSDGETSSVLKSDLSAYRQTELADLERPAAPGDRARTLGYTVTDEKLETLVSLLDYALTSSEVGGFWGWISMPLQIRFSKRSIRTRP